MGYHTELDSAVAVNYATGESFDQKETHIIYDAGASSITATVVSFHNSPIPDPTKVLKSSLKNATHVDVHSFGFDVIASGTELDRRLREKLVKMFEAKHPVEAKGLRKNGRAMARLWKEAQRVKSVLSANTESAVRVESLVGDVDFKDQITRADFEALAGELQFARPIQEALEKAKLTMVTAHGKQFGLNLTYKLPGRYQVCYPHWWHFPCPYGPSGCKRSGWRVSCRAIILETDNSSRTLQ